jgi:hypothetical protein
MLKPVNFRKKYYIFAFTILLAACTQVNPTLDSPDQAPRPVPSATATDPAINDDLGDQATPITPATLLPSVPDDRADRLISIPLEVPPVDLTIHSVPLGDVYFDTFQAANRAVQLDKASSQLIERLRDAIPPIHDPKYETAAQANWLRSEDVVLGYTSGKEAWAYPIKILNFHEIVNDRLGGEPVLVSYCPLCFSGIVYSRRLGANVLTFGNTSALYESDLVMLDYDTGSYWWQVAGRAIVGPLTGESLTLLPSSITTWSDWLARHPDTRVLSRDTGFNREYGFDPFQSYASRVNNGRFAFPVTDSIDDSRLKAGDKVLAVQISDDIRVYPIKLGKKVAINEDIGEQDIVVFLDSELESGAAFNALVNGRQYTFISIEDSFFDEQTSSEWNLSGQAVDGPLKGTRLEPLPTKTTFWFAIVAAEPSLILFEDTVD